MGKLFIVKLWRQLSVRLRKKDYEKSFHTSKKTQFTLEIELISP